MKTLAFFSVCQKSIYLKFGRRIFFWRFRYIEKIISFIKLKIWWPNPVFRSSYNVIPGKGVCKHTLNLNSWNVLCLFPTKFSKTQLQIFSCQNRKSELSIDGLIISVPLLTFGATHQSKALIFYFGMKKCWVGFLKILSKTDKLNFIFWNLGCV